MRAAWLLIFGGILSAGPAAAGIELITEPPGPPAAQKEIDLDLGDYVPSSGTDPRLADPDIQEIVAACDRLAAHPGNDENPEGIDGVQYTELDGTKALPACLKAVELLPDVARLQYQLARAKHASGQRRAAIANLTTLAEDNYVPAINNLGATYQLGIGVAKDYAKALYWYTKAAEQGFVPSMTILGWMHHKGMGTAADNDVAVRWYREAAEGGSASAMNHLGFSYHNGWGVEQDAAQAATWFRKAADLGFAPAMSMTAWAHQVGRGVPVDGPQAISWYERAAEAGELSAFGALGGFYDTGGSGIARQPQMAAEWLIEAIRKGHEGTRMRLIENSTSLHPETRKAVQFALKEAGFDPGPIDGVFGQKTYDALDEAFTAP